LYIFKGYGVRHQDEEDGQRGQQDEEAAVKAYIFFLNSVIFIHKLDIIRKEYVIWLQIFSAAVLPNIIKIGQQLTK